MRETHVPLESVGERLRAFDQRCWRWTKAAIRIFERLQTTTYIKFELLELVSDYILKKTVVAFVLENNRIRDKYAQKYFYTFTINKIIFTNG